MQRFLAVLFILIFSASILIAQENPGELKTLSDKEKQELAGLPELKLPQQYQNKTLPVEVDNSSLIYYPGLFLQAGLCCGQAAAIGLGYSYEMCRLRNQNGTSTANNFPTHFTWNWENGGFGYYGVSYYHSLEILRLVGCPTTDVYGGTLSFGGSSRWMSGYDSYYSAMHNRIINAYSIKTNTAEGILTLKNWLNDHLDGSTTGGVGFFYSQYQSPTNNLPAGTPHAGERVIVSWGASANHGMNICGYNDEIKWDFNGDGQYTNNIDINSDGVVNVKDWEIGAFKMANTYSSPYYAWMMYKTLADLSTQGGIWNNTVNVVYGKETYEPQLTYKINLYYTHRKRIKIRAGMSTNTADTHPQYVIEYPIINYQGEDMGMQGGNEEAQKYIEFGLDVTPFLNYIAPGTNAKFFFEIIEDDPDVWGAGNVISYSLMDYTSGLVETSCLQSNVAIANNTTTQLTITKTINYDDVNITSTVLPIAEVYHDYSYQLLANGGTPPYRWEFDMDYNMVSSTSTLPTDITTSFSGSSLSLPFPINFYGQEYTSINVSNDGYIDFTGEPYSLPYQHEQMTTFMNRKCIAPCMMDLNANVYYKIGADYVAIRWSSSGIIETAVKIYTNGTIEYYYGSSSMPYDQVWIGGISSGNQINYTLFPFTGSSNIPANTKYTFQPQTLPTEFQLSSTGLLTGQPTQELLAYNLNFKVYDDNNLIDRKTIPISTNGLIVSTEIHTPDNDSLEWGENAWVRLTLRNATTSSMTNLDVTLTTPNNQIVITQGAQPDIDLAPGEEMEIVNGFEFNTLYNFNNGQVVPFEIHAVCDQSSWDIPITEPIYIAVLENNDQWVDDSDNNRLDIGETSDVHFYIDNIGGSEVGDLDMTISTVDPFITLNTTSFYIDQINSQQQKPAIFNITASPETPVGHLAYITMNITGDHNYSETIVLRLTIGQIIEDWETGDLSSFEWELTGSANWFTTDQNVYEGQYCLKSGPITHSQQSNLTIALEVLASGEISFARAVSCENDVNNNWDYLSFSIDGNEIQRWDGELGWEVFTYSVNSGVHTFNWKYIKDGSVNTGQDCAWVDNIVFPSIYDTPPVLVLSTDTIEKFMHPDEIDIDTLYVMNYGGGILDYRFEILNVLPGSLNEKSIAGSTVTCDQNSFVMGDNVTWNFTFYNASTDSEWLKQIYFDFPTGVNVTSATDIVDQSTDTLYTSGILGDGVIISWFGEDENGWGIIQGSEYGYCTIEASIADDFVGDIEIEYQLQGDIYGAEPHVISGIVDIINLGPPIDWFSVDPLQEQVIIGEVDTIMMTFNTTGMEIGVYECILKIFSDADTVEIPVILHVDTDIHSELSINNQNLQVYPNPSSDNFTIEVNRETENFYCEVYDVTGKLIWNQASNGNQKMIWSTGKDLSDGIYLMKISGDNFVETKRLILKH